MTNNYDSIESIIEKFSHHPSILMINKKIEVADRFDFTPSTMDMVELELSRLNPKKASTFKNIPSKLLKTNKDICGCSFFFVHV